MIRRRLIVTGRVQNVFYRDWFVKQMAGLGVRGWVRNRTNGSVEAVVEGASELVDAAIDKARQGSPASRVTDVTVREDAAPETLSGFVKRPTV